MLILIIKQVMIRLDLVLVKSLIKKLNRINCLLGTAPHPVSS